MDKNLEKIKEKITESLKPQEIIVDDISFVSEGKYKFLRVVLDKVSGIDLETIVEATHIINPIIDKFDISDDSYILDVISKEREEA